ncbi:Hypothetical protein AT6N2_L1465 [Agrobacterium tumefaciens]|nr:Hypothetical protein AT6N2_L1465 [Agrobacterium tumefaciens]
MNMRAALHQRLHIFAEFLDPFEEVIEGQHHAARSRHLAHFIQHCRHFLIGADQGSHIDIDRRNGVGHMPYIGVGAGFGIDGALQAKPFDRVLIRASLVMLPLRPGILGFFLGEHHRQHNGFNLAAALFRCRQQALISGRKGLRRIDAHAKAEAVIREFGRERHAGIGRTGADELHITLRHRLHAAIVHLEELALEIRLPFRQQLFQHSRIFAEIFVTIAEIIVTRPKPHLAIFRPLPAGDQVDAKTATGNGIDRGCHARNDSRRHDQRGGGAEQLDLGGDGGQPRHQREGFQIVIPELGLAAEATQLDHRQRKVETILLGLQRDRLVEIEARLVLRRVFGKKPSIVPDRDKNTNFHFTVPFLTSGVS